MKHFTTLNAMKIRIILMKKESTIWEEEAFLNLVLRVLEHEKGVDLPFLTLLVGKYTSQLFLILYLFYNYKHIELFVAMFISKKNEVWVVFHILFFESHILEPNMREMWNMMWCWWGIGWKKSITMCLFFNLCLINITSLFFLCGS